MFRKAFLTEGKCSLFGISKKKKLTSELHLDGMKKHYRGDGSLLLIHEFRSFSLTEWLIQKTVLSDLKRLRASDVLFSPVTFSYNRNPDRIYSDIGRGSRQ